MSPTVPPCPSLSHSPSPSPALLSFPHDSMCSLLLLGLSLDACVELRESGQMKRVEDSCAKASRGGTKRRGRRGRGSELDSAEPEQVSKRLWWQCGWLALSGQLVLMLVISLGL